MKVERVREELYGLFKAYPRAFEIFRAFEEDSYVQRLHALANNFVINRLGYNDHGRTHAYIVARNALQILRILTEKGVEPNVVREGNGDVEDAAAIVTVAGFLHDIGNAVHRENHHMHSLLLAAPILDRLLPEERQALLKTAILEAIYAHETVNAVSIEASIVKIADGLDMEEGRARIPYSMGKFDIHAVSALSIRRVRVEPGENTALRVVVDMEHTAGLFQVEKVLGEKIRTSALRGNVEVLMRIPNVGERTLLF